MKVILTNKTSIESWIEEKVSFCYSILVLYCYKAYSPYLSTSHFTSGFKPKVSFQFTTDLTPTASISLAVSEIDWNGWEIIQLHRFFFSFLFGGIGTNIEKYLLLREFSYLLGICGYFCLKLELSLLLLMPACVFNCPPSMPILGGMFLAHDFPHFLLLWLKLGGFSLILEKY